MGMTDKWEYHTVERQTGKWDHYTVVRHKDGTTTTYLNGKRVPNKGTW